MSDRPVAFNKKSFILKVYTVTICIVGSYLGLFAIMGVTGADNTLLCCFAAFLLIGFSFTSMSKFPNFWAHYFVVCCYTFLMINTSISGGIMSPGVIWFLLCPVVSFMTLSKKATAIWITVILSSLLIFYLFADALVVAPPSRNALWYLIAHIFLFATVYYVLQIFNKEINIKSKDLARANAELERSHRHLTDSQAELIDKNERLRIAEVQASERNNRLRYYLHQLLEVSRMEEIHTGSLGFSLEIIQEILMTTMALDAVSIWHLDEAGKNLTLVGTKGKEGYTQPSVLSKDDLSETSELLESGVIIVSGNGENASSQLSLQLNYPHENTSIIGCPYFIEGKFAGFFSCRTTDREWTSEDLIFVRAISDTIPLAFKSHQRRRQQILLESKQRQIEELNDSLEKKVMERTTELRRRNKQLLDFAFINAHEIRAPICRLLGLKNLLALKHSEDELKTIVDYMADSIEELDVITHRASILLASELPETEHKQ